MWRRAEWIVAVFVYSVCALLGVVACGRRTPELMAVSGLTPQSVAENDLITLRGEGFVVGPEANVRFSGTVYRPGFESEHLDLRVPGSAVDGENLEVVVSAAMVERMCDASNGAHVLHATFRGDVEVAFAPRTKGAPPIVGSARDVALDVFRHIPEQPLLSTKGIAGYAPAGAFDEVPRALGFRFADNAGKGLDVIEVEQGSKAALAGLRVGDVLHRWSGVRVFSPRDVDVYPGQRTAELEVVRTGHAVPVELHMDVAGLSPLDAKGWNVGLVLLGVMVVALLVSRSQLSQWLVWLVVAKPQTRQVKTRQLGIVPFLLVSAAFLALALRRDVVPFELDLALVGFACCFALGFFGLGCAFTERGFSLRKLVQVWFRQLPLHVAFAVAMTALVLERGHASVWELAATQGIGPLSYGAFVSPPSFLVALVWAATAVVVTMGAEVPRASARWFSMFARACGEAASLAIAALVLAVFLGGWSTSASAPGHLGWSHALYFQLRFTALFVVLGLTRRYVPPPPLEAVSAWAWKVLVPAACFALAVLPVWWAEIWPAWVRAGAKGFLLGLGCVVALGIPLATVVLRRVAATGRRTGLNPWL